MAGQKRSTALSTHTLQPAPNFFKRSLLEVILHAKKKSMTMPFGFPHLHHAEAGPDQTQAQEKIMA